MIDNGVLNYKSYSFTDLFVDKILQKVIECPIIFIKIFDKNVKLIASDFAYVAKFFHKKLKIEAHLLKILFWVPKKVIIRQEIFSCSQHWSVLSMQTPQVVVLEGVLPFAKQSQLLVKFKLSFL